MCTAQPSGPGRENPIIAAGTRRLTLPKSVENGILGVCGLVGELGVAVHEAGDVEDPIPLGVDGVGERQGAHVRDEGAHFFCS